MTYEVKVLNPKLDFRLKKILLKESLKDLWLKFKLMFCKKRISEDVNTHDEIVCRVEYKLMGGHVYIVDQKLIYKDGRK